MSKQIHKKTFVMFCMIIISLFWSKLQKGVYIILPREIVDFFRYQAVFFYFNRRTCLPFEQYAETTAIHISDLFELWILLLTKFLFIWQDS